MKCNQYLRLMRLDKPIGILLLWYPTAWALWVASHGQPPLALVFLFFIGTVLMRSAGCIINDFADRDIDLYVRRTASRPLTSGELKIKEAMILAGILFMAAFLILLKLPVACFYCALLSFAVAVFYPFCKRFFKSPQMILGIAFSMGIPMAFLATHHAFSKEMGYLLALNSLWVLTYDTQYAMVDRRDDLHIGVHSMAIFLGRFDCLVIGILQIVFHMTWLILAYQCGYTFSFMIIWGVAALCLIYQQKLISSRQVEDCFNAFLNNNWYGLLMWIGVMMQTKA